MHVLTHCNAGALATSSLGTATAPIYLAHRAGIAVHVWVSETRPRLQGARLTTLELHAEGVPHTLIVDAAGATLMQQRRVDLVLVGADRVAANSDVCNKIGTYEKALAANDTACRSTSPFLRRPSTGRYRTAPRFPSRNAPPMKCCSPRGRRQSRRATRACSTRHSMSRRRAC